MTEINIQRKSGNSVLWWVLGIIALAVIAWFIFAGTDGMQYGLSTGIGHGPLAAVIGAAAAAA